MGLGTDFIIKYSQILQKENRCLSEDHRQKVKGRVGTLTRIMNKKKLLQQEKILKWNIKIYLNETEKKMATRMKNKTWGD